MSEILVFYLGRSSSISFGRRVCPKGSCEVSVIGSSTADITGCSGSVDGLSKSSLVVVISVGLLFVMFFCIHASL